MSDEETVPVSYNGYAFTPSYLATTVAAGGYTLQTDGSAYAAVPTGQSVDVAPFRPYFSAAASSVRTRSIAFSTSSSQPGGPLPGDTSPGPAASLSIHAAKGAIVVESSLSEACEVRIVTPAGVPLSTFTIEPGETVRTRVNITGIYIVTTSAGHSKKLRVTSSQR